MPKTDHASERRSRKAKRLDSREWRGTLLHALLKSFRHLSFLLLFFSCSKLVSKRLDIESLSHKDITYPHPHLTGLSQFILTTVSSNSNLAIFDTLLTV